MWESRRELPVVLPTLLPAQLMPALPGPPWVTKTALRVRVGGAEDESAADAARSLDSNCYDCSQQLHLSGCDGPRPPLLPQAAHVGLRSSVLGEGWGTLQWQRRREGGGCEAGENKATPQATRGGGAGGDGLGGGGVRLGRAVARSRRPKQPTEAAAGAACAAFTASGVVGRQGGG